MQMARCRLTAVRNADKRAYDCEIIAAIKATSAVSPNIERSVNRRVPRQRAMPTTPASSASSQCGTFTYHVSPAC
jgi:hypothetical protein